MGRTSRRSSEEHSTRKRHRRGSSSPRRSPSSDRDHRSKRHTTTKSSRSRNDKVKRSRSRSDSRSYKKSRSVSPQPHVTTRRMSMQMQEKQVPAPVEANHLQTDVMKNEGDFENYPEITPKTRESLKARGINYLFPVQTGSFRQVWSRKDLIVRDLTGSGKTLGFALPTVEWLRKQKTLGSGRIQAMILAPTRELAIQVTKEFNALKHHEHEYNVLTVYGGVSIEDQTYQLRKGVDIFVGTTGRILDHMERRNFDFQNLRTVVLDEADQMLKLGFKEDVERIMRAVKEKAPKDIQTLLFSATVPHWVKAMAKEFLSPQLEFIDLAQNLKNKTSRTVNHLAINCPW